MSKENNTQSLSDTLREESAKPLTMKDRIVGIVLALLFAGAGVGMLLSPDLFTFGDERPTGRGGRMIAFLLEVLWSRPVGGVLVLLALLMIWGSITKKSAESG